MPEPIVNFAKINLLLLVVNKLAIREQLVEIIQHIVPVERSTKGQDALILDGAVKKSSQMQSSTVYHVDHILWREPPGHVSLQSLDNYLTCCAGRVDYTTHIECRVHLSTFIRNWSGEESSITMTQLTTNLGLSSLTNFQTACSALVLLAAYTFVAFSGRYGGGKST